MQTDPKRAPSTPATPEILIGYCGPIEWAMLDAPGDPVWRRAVWGPIGPSSEPERMGIVNAGDMRGNIAMRLPLAHPLAMCHAARWLAGRLGMEPGSTSPRWDFVPAEDDGMVTPAPAHFCLIGLDWVRVFTEEHGFNAQYFFGDPRPILRQTRNDAGVEAYEVRPWRPTTVPGILGMDPAEALAAACMALAPA